MAQVEKNGNIEEIYGEKEIEWKIDSFSSIDENKIIESPTFSFENSSSWFFRLRPKITQMPGFVAFSLHCRKPWEYSVKYDIGFKKLDGSIAQLNIGIFKENGKTFREFVFKLSEILEQKCDVASFNVVTITSTLKREVVHSYQQRVRKKPKLTELIKLDTLSENFKNLSKTKASCDVILKVKEKEFRAHKAILTARSSVFAAMFEHDTSEKQTGIIDIPDCDPDSFHEFLDYLYCGKLENISFPSTLHLYKTSDKYNAQELKLFCVEFMEQNLTEENVCDAVILADMYEEIKLMSAAQSFFNKNLSKVVVTTAWENLMNNDYRLANKLIKELSSKIKIID